MPSHREGTPRTILEAMSMKRAIITTNAPGCRGTVDEGVNGFKVVVGDSDAIADRMIYFIEHPEKIVSMGESSYSICEKKYDVNKVNKDMCNIMNIMTAKSGGMK